VLHGFSPDVPRQSTGWRRASALHKPPHKSKRL
jgi:hypothetical protein